ncbi:RAP protein, putative [Plasmodium reichenowi]|uniref:RAP protein, putative n=1 Tax=Plasmodium reichenowi TaxID=5854 RepID=A0A151LML0_PLARE|nr:RAP protein, putative [Plasmodium reichenowi]KYO00402.1 RAP protein, putative [Plasmodium reichenowi]
MINFFNIVVFVLHLFYIIGIIILFLDHVQSSKLNIVYKPNGSFSKPLFISNLFDFKEKFKNNFVKNRKKSDTNYYHDNYKRNYSNTNSNIFIESFNKKNTFIKPIYVTFQDDMNKSVASQNESKKKKKKKKNSEQNQLFLKSTKQKDINEMTIDEEIENYDNIQMDKEEMNNKEDHKESDINDKNNNDYSYDKNNDYSYDNNNNNNNYSYDNNNNNYSNDKNNNNNYFKNMDNSEYELVNDYILLRKNGLTIKELMEQGKWACPKENLKMIRERVNSKINWNYILKKNNELLKDNVDKIYHGIYKKENVDDLLFVFDTYPYNYLNITMSVFSLYKFANSYLNEKKEKMNSVNEKKSNFFNNISSKNFLIKEDEKKKKKKKDDMENINELLNIKHNDNKSRCNEKTNSYDDNFFALENIQDDVGDNNIFKIKEERKRLYYITTNRNFQRIVGSINKHLKIIYRIFSSNEKLSSYEKNKNVYKFIPYINIKDIIIILKSFCILKYDHANIYKYIYFFIVHFIHKFDIYNLCQAVHLCIIKQIYIKPLYQNFLKYLHNIFQQDKNDYIGKIEIAQSKTSLSSNNKKDTHEELQDNHNATNKNNVKKDILLNIKSYDNNRNNLCKDIISLYDAINIKDFYNNIENAMEGYSSNPCNYYTSPLYNNNFNYYIYHSCNYSNINNALDDAEEKKEKEKDIKGFMTKDMRKEKESFIEHNINKDITINENNNNINNVNNINNINNVNNINNTNNRKDINLYVYILYVLSKFPYSNVNIINKIILHILKDIHNLSIDELILTFYSIAELEYEDYEVQNYLYLLIFQRLHLLNYRNNDTLLKLIKSLYLTNNLDRVYDCTKMENTPVKVDVKGREKGKQQDDEKEKDDEEDKRKNEQKQNEFHNKEDEKKGEFHIMDNENNSLSNKKKNCDYKKHVEKEHSDSFIEHINNDESNKMESIKTLMIYVISKMVLKNINNYSPTELVDIIRYLSAFKFINKELFSFVYNLPFFKNLNEDILNYYKNNVYFNQSYYAYTKNNNINTPIEIMLCKLYQSYLSYNMFIKQIDTSYIKNVIKDDIIKTIYKRNNEQVKVIQFNNSIIQLLKNTYLNNMKISSYASSSLHYEIADIINKDFKIPCHVEYQTSNGIIIDIAILYEDIKKIDPTCPFFKNIAIEINGPFHYKTKSLSNHFPLINTKTILKKRLLQFEDWDVISFPFWEIKPWFSKTRKESYILKMLPEKLKTFFK